MKIKNSDSKYNDFEDSDFYALGLDKRKYVAFKKL
jgi:hypothetical protein